eukprot:scaffold139401_cov66-Cyclotella_meneghiniana.AAC.3
MGDYWLRHVRTDYTETFAQELDTIVASLLQTIEAVAYVLKQWIERLVNTWEQQYIQLPALPT